MVINILVSYITRIITKNKIALLVKNLSGKIVNFCKLNPTSVNVTGKRFFRFCYFNTMVTTQYQKRS